MTKPSISSLHFIEQAAMLIDMPRSHVRNLGNNTPDTIASHCYLVAVIGYVITRLEGHSHHEGLEAIAMGTFHDLLESRTGDTDFVAKNYVKVDEAKALHDQFARVPFGADLLDLMTAYEQRQTAIAKCVKDSDALAQMYIEWLMGWRGNKLAQKWFDDDFINRVPHLRTKSAQAIAQAMKNSNPHEWWWQEFVTESMNLHHLNGK